MAVREAHAFLGEAIDIGRLDLASVTPHIRPAGIIEEDQEKIGFVCSQ